MAEVIEYDQDGYWIVINLPISEVKANSAEGYVTYREGEELVKREFANSLDTIRFVNWLSDNCA